jgi:hypothetical protein
MTRCSSSGLSVELSDGQRVCRRTVETVSRDDGQARVTGGRGKEGVGGKDRCGSALGKRYGKAGFHGPLVPCSRIGLGVGHGRGLITADLENEKRNAVFWVGGQRGGCSPGRGRDVGVDVLVCLSRAVPSRRSPRRGQRIPGSPYDPPFACPSLENQPNKPPKSSVISPYLCLAFRSRCSSPPKKKKREPLRSFGPSIERGAWWWSNVMDRAY